MIGRPVLNREHPQLVGLQLKGAVMSAPMSAPMEGLA
jgi:hypothetical protein